jgi:hypothetical protein
LVLILEAQTVHLCTVDLPVYPSCAASGFVPAVPMPDKSVCRDTTANPSQDLQPWPVATSKRALLTLLIHWPAGQATVG